MIKHLILKYHKGNTFIRNDKTHEYKSNFAKFHTRLSQKAQTHADTHIPINVPFIPLIKLK